MSGYVYKGSFNISEKQRIWSKVFSKYFWKDKNEYFTVGIVYRSPNSCESENTNFLNHIDFTSSKFLSSNEKLLLVGDFNFPGINWDDECSNMSDTHCATKFLNITPQNYLTPVYYRGNSQQKYANTNIDWSCLVKWPRVCSECRAPSTIWKKSPFCPNLFVIN